MFHDTHAYSGFSIDEIAPAKIFYANTPVETDVAGIFRGDRALIDWFTDPAGNTLCELQGA
ncbi:hypothetical protein ACFY5D_03825 [Paeniglutamicibacter sp. NPDC012692]|uniref:hypothetical protein n=1 Tax=Paeniglutamicibacter sp. NPDC012692 TaxID=3364388 RepID=UPI0036C3CDAB